MHSAASGILFAGDAADFNPGSHGVALCSNRACNLPRPERDCRFRRTGENGPAPESKLVRVPYALEVQAVRRSGDATERQ